MMEAVSVTSVDAENRSLRKSQRTSKTNLMRSSLSPPKPATEIKDYELNVNKAIIKKLDHQGFPFPLFVPEVHTMKFLAAHRQRY
jgi:tRNA A37 threonylcarbamoyladenosine dehydratase